LKVNEESELLPLDCKENENNNNDINNSLTIPVIYEDQSEIDFNHIEFQEFGK
jgi:hypothetical protein